MLEIQTALLVRLRFIFMQPHDPLTALLYNVHLEVSAQFLLFSGLEAFGAIDLSLELVSVADS